MMAYLMMMAIRLKELHRVLKPTMKRPFLIGERVYLRPLEEEDIDRCLVWINNPEITATPTLRKRNGGRSILPRRRSDRKLSVRSVE